MEEAIKNGYAPPAVEVIPVKLENNVALHSPIRKVDVATWEPDEEITPDTGDIFLAL